MADVQNEPVNWEAVRALAMVVGVREAARRMGLSEEAAMKHSQRKGWLASPEAKRANQMAITARTGGRGVPAELRPQMSAGALIQAEIASLGSKTRLSLARGIAKAGEHVETLNGDAVLAQSQEIKAVAQTADLVHGWKDSTPQVKIRLDVLNAPQEAQIIDVESSPIDELTDSAPSDCLDDY